jgi:hypothetical protein
MRHGYFAVSSVLSKSSEKCHRQTVHLKYLLWLSLHCFTTGAPVALTMSMRLTVLSFILLLMPLFQNCGSSFAVSDAEGIGSISDKSLSSLEAEIRQSISLQCSSSWECHVATAGSKPCGGPSRYFIYSSSTSNVTAIEQLTDEYTALQQLQNQSTNAVGTCDALDVPTSLSCISNQCAPSF